MSLFVLLLLVVIGLWMAGALVLREATRGKGVMVFATFGLLLFTLLGLRILSAPRVRHLPPEAASLHAPPPVSAGAAFHQLTQPRIALDAFDVEAPAAVETVGETVEAPATTVVSEFPTADVQPAAAVEPPTPARPDWVDLPPTRLGETYRRTIQGVGNGSRLEHRYEDAEKKFVAAIFRYLNDHGVDADLRDSRPLASYGLTLAELREKFWRDEYLPPQQSGRGPWLVYVLVEITPEDGRWLVETVNSANAEFHPFTYGAAFADSVAASSSAGVQPVATPAEAAPVAPHAGEPRRSNETLDVSAVVFSLVLITLAAVYGLLRLDQATNGRYTKRLLIGVPVGILGFFVLLVFLNEIDVINL